MKVKELIEYLEDQEPDLEVLVAHQPNWPLQETVSHVSSMEDIAFEEDWDDVDREEKGKFVWIVAGGHPWDASPYAPRSVFNR